MPRLFHLANFNSTNIGNGALISGTERVLQEDLGERIEFVREAWDDYNFEKRFDEDFVRRVNEESDCLLVGGAVAINGRAYLSNSGWRLDLPPELWPTIRVPILIGGISHRFWKDQPFHHLDRFRSSVRFLLQRENTWFGVRNDGTKAWMENLLQESLPGIHEMPDPALFVETRESFHPELKPGCRNVLIAFNSEDEEWRFGPSGAEAKANFLTILSRVVVRLFDEWKDIQLILCPHYLDDFRFMAEFIQHLPPRIAHRHTVAAGMYRVSQTGYFYDLYRSVDLAVAMRVHSMSPSIGLGVPCVPITSQSRMVHFLEDVGLEQLSVDFGDPELENQLYLKMSACLNRPKNIKVLMQKAVEECRGRMRKFTRAAAELTGASAL